MTAVNTQEINNLIDTTQRSYRSRRQFKVDYFPQYNEIKLTRTNCHFPTSWFITDEAGEIGLLGSISNEEQTIDLQQLTAGCHQFRINGDVYELTSN